MSDLDNAISDELIPEDGVLTGYVIAVEYLDPKGDKLYLTYGESENASPWQIQGWLHTAIRSFERDIADSEGDDDE